MMKSDDKLKRVHILLSQIFSWILLAFHYSHFSNILQSSILLRDQEEYTYVHEAAGWQQKNNKSRECPLPVVGTGRPPLYRYGGIESFVLGPPFKLHTYNFSLPVSLLPPLGKALPGRVASPVVCAPVRGIEGWCRGNARSRRQPLFRRSWRSSAPSPTPTL